MNQSSQLPPHGPTTPLERVVLAPIGWIGASLKRLVLIQPGEGKAVVLAAAYFFLILFSYYLMRPFREAVGIERGADQLPALFTATLIVMALVNPLFAWLVSRMPRRRFIPIAHRFFIANLVILFVLFRYLPPGGIPMLGKSFYVWVSVFNLFIVSVFWAFMADIFGRQAGPRLFGLLAVGGTLGAMAGAAVVKLLTGGFLLVGHEIKAPPETMLLLSSVTLEGATWCVLALAAIPAIPAVSTGAPVAEPGRGVLEGLRLLTTSPYLRLITLYMLLFSFTATLLYFKQADIIERTIPDRAARTRAFADLDLWTNTVTLVVQVLLTGRLIRWIGLSAALAVVPAITIAGFTMLLVSPTIDMLKWFQVARRSLHYAVDRPSRELLFTPLNADSRYKSKSFIDTFVYRSGDVLGAWAPTLLGPVGGIATVAFSAAWLLVGVTLGARFRKLAPAASGVTSARTDGAAPFRS